MRVGSVAAAVLVIGLQIPSAWGVWTEECVRQGCIDGPAKFPCCSPSGSCFESQGTSGCYEGSPAQACLGDANGNGVDDACQCSADLATACCLGDGGCQDALTPAACEAAGGVPFGTCATCAQVACPVAECIGATGSCGEAHPTPGCESLYCCNQVCSQLPECCEAEAPEVPAASPVGLAALLLAGAAVCAWLALAAARRRS